MLCAVTAIRTLRVPVTRSVMRGIPTRSVGTIKSVGARLAREAGDVIYLMHRVVDFAGKPRSNMDRLT